MTTAAPKLAGFAVALAVLFGIGALAGGLINPAPPNSAKAAHEPMQSETAMSIRGLGVASDGLRLVLATPVFERGQTRDIRFQVLDQQGRAVHDFDVEHTKRMHLIVVRRDLTGFQHLHPTLQPDGTWTTPLRLDAAGTYRVFADFSHDGKPTTLATDLTVNGPFSSAALPAPQPHATVDGFDVTLHRGATLQFGITRNGRPVQVQQYLGADGHLVILREGDLAFLHVHPTDDGAQTIDFEATFPTSGRYRLFLQFKVDGKVHTAAFTEEVS